MSAPSIAVLTRGADGLLKLRGGPLVVGENETAFLQTLGHVDLPDEGGVDDDDNIWLVDLGVDPDGAVGDPGESPDGCPHPLRTELGECLHILTGIYGRFGEDLVRSDDTLTSSSVPTYLCVH